MPIKTWLRRAYISQAAPRYLGTIATVSALILALFLFNSGAAEVGAAGLLLVGLLALVPASHLATAFVNREVTELLGPRALPRLALRDGVPEELRTLIVVPTLLIGQEQIAEQIERLEVHYLANSDGDLRFALLSDWTDAPQESMPEDDKLRAAAVEGIALLNQRHGPALDTAMSGVSLVPMTGVVSASTSPPPTPPGAANPPSSGGGGALPLLAVLLLTVVALARGTEARRRYPAASRTSCSGGADQVPLTDVVIGATGAGSPAPSSSRRRSW